jgi:hypothetical protein
MTEENVKKGFNDSPFVQNEHFSAHDVIYDELKKANTLKNLGDFMTDIMKRKIETNTFQGYLGLCSSLIYFNLTLFSYFFFFLFSYSYYRSSQFMGPTIVWVTLEERDKWLRDLAGNIPLKVLAKSVPKG